MVVSDLLLRTLLIQFRIISVQHFIIVSASFNIFDIHLFYLAFVYDGLDDTDAKTHYVSHVTGLLGVLVLVAG